MKSRKGQIVRNAINAQHTLNTFLDKQLIRNILFNLLSNGIKYSQNSKPILLNVLAQEEMISIEICDRSIFTIYRVIKYKLSTAIGQPLRFRATISRDLYI